MRFNIDSFTMVLTAWMLAWVARDQDAGGQSGRRRIANRPSALE